MVDALSLCLVDIPVSASRRVIPVSTLPLTAYCLLQHTILPDAEDAYYYTSYSILFYQTPRTAVHVYESSTPRSLHLV